MSAIIASRFSFRIMRCSPGRLYNIGNAIGFAAGLVVAASRPASGATNAWHAVLDCVMGSRSAVLMTLATLLFFASGDFYARAFRHVARVSLARTQTRIADLLSGLGSVLLAAALACLGSPILAIVSGTLSAGGKLGSACFSRPGSVMRPWERRLNRWCRIAPLLSRFPAAAAAFAGLLGAGAAGDVPGIVLSGVMLGCYALWATADALLVAGERA